MKNSKIKEKNFLINFVFFVCLIFITKICLTIYVFNYIYENKLEKFITSKYTKDERIIKFSILKNINKNYDLYFFGSSSSGIFYPKFLDKYNAFNTSYSGASSTDHLSFLEWILANKNIPKKIFLEIKPFSIYDHDYAVINPPELKSFFYKMRYYFLEKEIFLFLLTESFFFQKFKKIYYNHNLFNSEKYSKGDYEMSLKKNKKKLNYIITGTRYYQNYFNNMEDKKLIKKNINSVLNTDIELIGDKIDKKKIMDLKRFVNICKINNIELKVFFGPTHISLLKKKNFKYFKRELNVINFLILNNIVEEIYYFNMEHYNSSPENFEKDSLHYNYDIGKKILLELINKNNENKNYLILKKKNLDILNRIYKNDKF